MKCQECKYEIPESFKFCNECGHKLQVSEQASPIDFTQLHSCFEVGKRLLEPDRNYNELKGITAEEYLEKVRIRFEEMDLQWDLDELDKVMAEK